MRVRTNVKLLCEACYKVRVQVSRDKAVYQVNCTKNPRHKQRTKWARPFSAASECTGHEHSHDVAVELDCGHTHTFSMATDGLMQQQNASRSGMSALLASRTSASLGELYWRASASGLNVSGHHGHCDH